MPSSPRCRRHLPLLLLALASLFGGPSASAEDDPPRDTGRVELVALPGGPPASLALPASPFPANLSPDNLFPGSPFPGGHAGRLPVVVLLTDSEGPGPRDEPYVARLLANGHAVLEPVQTGGDTGDGGPGSPAVPLVARLAPALAAIAADPRLDRDQVVVLGMGEGARAALLGWAAGARVAGLALLYPGCDADLAAAAGAAAARAGDGAAGSTRVLLLHGDADATNPADACARVAASFPPANPVSHRVLAGASYAWDGYGLVPPGGAMLPAHPAGGGARTWSRPDPQVTLVAADRVLGFVMAALAAR